MPAKDDEGKSKGEEDSFDDNRGSNFDVDDYVAEEKDVMEEEGVDQGKEKSEYLYFATKFVYYNSCCTTIVCSNDLRLFSI